MSVLEVHEQLPRGCKYLQTEEKFTEWSLQDLLHTWWIVTTCIMVCFATFPGKVFFFAFFFMYQLIPSLTITLLDFFKERIPHPSGTKKVQNLVLKPHLEAIISKNPAKTPSKSRNRIYEKQQYWNAIRNRKLLGWWLLWIFKISQIILATAKNSNQLLL